MTIEQTLQQLIEFLKAASPVLWATLVRQVLVDAAKMGVWLIANIIGLVLLLKAGKYGLKEEAADTSIYSSGDWNILALFSFMGAATCAVLIIVFLTSIIGRVINPEFYAIRYILEGIK